jgi:hypothetical protein
MSPNMSVQNFISTCSWCRSLCCVCTKPMQTPTQNNIAVYCHSHQYAHYDFNSTTLYGAQLATVTPITALWSLWKHSVQFPLILLLIFSRTATHFLYESPQYCYIIKNYSSQAHLSHSVILMIHSLRGLKWFECCEISKEELLLQFMFNGSIVSHNSNLKNPVTLTANFSHISSISSYFICSLSKTSVTTFCSNIKPNLKL